MDQEPSDNQVWHYVMMDYLENHDDEDDCIDHSVLMQLTGGDRIYVDYAVITSWHKIFEALHGGLDEGFYE